MLISGIHFLAFSYTAMKIMYKSPTIVKLNFYEKKGNVLLLDLVIHAYNSAHDRWLRTHQEFEASV